MTSLEKASTLLKMRFPIAKISKDLGVSKSNVSEYYNGKKPMSENFKEQFNNFYKVNLVDLEDDSNSMDANNLNVNDAFELSESENTNGNMFSALPNGQYVMTMPLAEVKIQAGLLDHFQDLDYIKGLDQHSIIVDKPARGRYLAFRVSGDSMDDDSKDAIPAGYIVSTRELQSHHWRSKIRFKDYRFWVIYTTEARMPLLKEIVAHDVEKCVITCHSLNDSPEYKDFDLSLNDIQALFYVIDVHRKTARDDYY